MQLGEVAHRHRGEQAGAPELVEDRFDAGRGFDVAPLPYVVDGVLVMHHQAMCWSAGTAARPAGRSASAAR